MLALVRGVGLKSSGLKTGSIYRGDEAPVFGYRNSLFFYDGFLLPIRHRVAAQDPAEATAPATAEPCRIELNAAWPEVTLIEDRTGSGTGWITSLRNSAYLNLAAHDWTLIHAF